MLDPVGSVLVELLFQIGVVGTGSSVGSGSPPVLEESGGCVVCVDLLVYGIQSEPIG